MIRGDPPHSFKSVGEIKPTNKVYGASDILIAREKRTQNTLIWQCIDTCVLSSSSVKNREKQVWAIGSWE